MKKIIMVIFMAAVCATLLILYMAVNNSQKQRREYNSAITTLSIVYDLYTSLKDKDGGCNQAKLINEINRKESDIAFEYDIRIAANIDDTAKWNPESEPIAYVVLNDGVLAIYQNGDVSVIAEHFDDLLSAYKKWPTIMANGKK
ncbi:MAG: hypothetical protein JXR97_04950 [Planctomycetes bacterium]|nr:hypothetical protein [Planctomycetota bacterium]